MFVRHAVFQLRMHTKRLQAWNSRAESLFASRSQRFANREPKRAERGKIIQQIDLWGIGISLATPPATNFAGGEMMTATIVDRLRLAGFQRSNEQTETVAARVAQGSFLSELPGLTFALLTLAYIVLSFLSL